MSSQFLVGSSSAKEEVRPEHILAEWSRAIGEVYKNYNELSGYIDDGIIPANQHKDVGKFIKQCPVDQLRKLVLSMHTELERLIQDMDQSGKSEQATSQRQYKRRDCSLNCVI